MRAKFIIYLSVILFCAINTMAQNKIASIPFKKGEELKFRVHYGLINAGEATITVDDKLHEIESSECYQINVFGRTTGPFDWVLRVRDTWRTFIDKNSVTAVKFYRHIEEGNYFTEETTYFDRERNIATVTERKRNGYKKFNKEYSIEEYTQDLISGFYYIRALDFNNLSPGELIPVNTFFEDTFYKAEVKYLGTEEIKTKFGKKNTHVFTPIIPNNELFENGANTIMVYYSDDKNKIPLKIKASMFIGAIECDLRSYKGLSERL
ncbi:MAG: DUF3108 domain-containing protein [Cytophagales bacterium]